ncbi:hypothetical protein JX266_008516 [Neoarthrinium moseri]|nr:hypothetical protein JX266_008516 [Neoarthrinium moseri]
MDNTNHAVHGMAVPPSRIPLSERSNTTSPTSACWTRKDSDELTRSQHSSVLDAGCISDSQVVKFRKVSPRPIKIPPPKHPTQIRLEDLRSESPLTRLESSTPFLYGQGTELDPIAEQQSIKTLRTASWSTSDLSSVMHGAPGSCNNNADGNRTGNGLLRRKRSFSLDDLDDIERWQNMRTATFRLSPIPSTGSPSEEVYAMDESTHKYPHSPPCSPPAMNRSLEDILKRIIGFISYSDLQPIPVEAEDSRAI